MNLGLGTSGGIGERKSEVSGHRDVTCKPAQEIQRKVNKWLPRKCLQFSFSKSHLPISNKGMTNRKKGHRDVTGRSSLEVKMAVKHQKSFSGDHSKNLKQCNEKNPDT